MGAGSGIGLEEGSRPGVAGGVRWFVAFACSLGFAAGCGESGQPASPEAGEKEQFSDLEHAPVSPEAVSVSGQVLDPQGRPPPRFVVRVLGVCTIDPPGLATKEVLDSKDGSFEFSGLQPGHIVIEASVPGFAPTFSAPLEAAPGTTFEDVIVRLERGGTLVGRVIDAHTADGIAGAVVSPFDALEGLSDSPYRPRGETDANGAFRVEHVPAGDCSLWIESAGHAPLAVEDVHVEEGKTRELPLLSLSLGATVAGVVHGAGGAALGGAEVHLQAADAAQYLAGRTMRTDEQGRFRLEHVTPGFYELMASRPASPQANPFEVLADMRRSQKEIGVAEGESYAFDLYLDYPPR